MGQYGPFFAVWGLCLLLGWAIGAGKGKSANGFLLALILGPLGVLVTACLTPTPAVQAQREAAVEAERAKLRGEASAGSVAES